MMNVYFKEIQCPYQYDDLSVLVNPFAKVVLEIRFSPDTLQQKMYRPL